MGLGGSRLTEEGERAEEIKAIGEKDRQMDDIIEEAPEMDPTGKRALIFEEFDCQRGQYETDLLYENDWRQRWDSCRKYPDHEDFIPRQDFSMEHLPAHIQHPEFLDYFKCAADLTCYLEMSYVSKKRPQTFPGRYNRGKHLSSPLVGTGIVSGSFLREDEPCPCVRCRNSTDPCKVWVKIQVNTVSHNVCHKSEAESTRAVLFYDTEEGRSGGQVFSLDGFDVQLCSTKSDTCRVAFASHDIDLYNKLQGIKTRCVHLLKNARRKYKEIVEQEEWPGGTVCVIPSHPHGSYKHLTVGETMHSHPSGKGYTPNSSIYDFLVYRTPTCPGSSGAPVIWVGKVDRLYISSTGDAIPVSEDRCPTDPVELFCLCLAKRFEDSDYHDTDKRDGQEKWAPSSPLHSRAIQPFGVSRSGVGGWL